MSDITVVQAMLIHGTLDHGRIEWQCPACSLIQQEPIDVIYGPSIELNCENCGKSFEFDVVKGPR
jgi:uncharacterized Zn finger protein